MSETQIHVGDVGTEFLLTVTDDACPTPAVLDISAATSLTYCFQRPDKTKFDVTPSFKTDGTDGQLTYLTVVGDLDQAGKWKLQAKVTLPGGDRSTEIVDFTVLGNVCT